MSLDMLADMTAADIGAMVRHPSAGAGQGAQTGPGGFDWRLTGV
jgi:hypothetical protein